MEDFKDHPSVQQIPNPNPVTQGRVLAVLESLNLRKATGNEGIPRKALRWPITVLRE